MPDRHDGDQDRLDELLDQADLEVADENLTQQPVLEQEAAGKATGFAMMKAPTTRLDERAGLGSSSTYQTIAVTGPGSCRNDDGGQQQHVAWRRWRGGEIGGYVQVGFR
jgi:hypothetical protein